MIRSSRAYRLLLSLFAVQLRANVVPIALNGMVLPIGALAAFPALRTPATVILMPLLGVTLLVIPPTIARLRHQGQITYFAGLAIDRFPLLLAFLTIYALVALLGISLTMLFAGVAIHMRLPFNVWSLIIVLPLAYLALAGVGMLLGVIIPSQAAVLATSNVVALLLLIGIVPALSQQAPAFARTFTGIVPSGLARKAFDDFGSWQTLFPLATALVLLLLYAAATLLVTAYIIPWRVETREKSFLGISSHNSVIASPPQLPTP
jgi:hypothetical protein